MKKENNKDNIKFLSEALLTPVIKTISLQTFKIMRDNLKSEEEAEEFVENLRNYKLDLNSVDVESYNDEFEFLRDMAGGKLKDYCVMDHFSNYEDIERYVFKVLEDFSHSGMTWEQKRQDEMECEQAFREMEDNYY